MTTYLVHPLVSDGVIKGAKVVEKPQINVWRDSPESLKAYHDYDAALQQSIDSALSFENQEPCMELLAKQYIDNTTAYSILVLKKQNKFYDSLSWRVTEVRQYIALKDVWMNWVDEDFPHEWEEHEDSKKRIVLRIVEEKEEPCLNCKETVSECACMRNKCKDCGDPVGNITFTVCDECWDKRHPKEPAQPEAPKEANIDIKKLKTVCRSFFGQGKVGYDPNPNVKFDYEWQQWIETGKIIPWHSHRSTGKEVVRITELTSAPPSSSHEELIKELWSLCASLAKKGTLTQEEYVTYRLVKKEVETITRKK